MFKHDFDHILQRIKKGSPVLSGQFYPLHTFKLGYLYAKTNLPLQVLIQCLEYLFRMLSTGYISQVIFKQLLMLIEDHPKEIDQITRALQKMMMKQPIDIVKFIQSYYKDGKCFINQRDMMVSSNDPEEKSSKKMSESKQNRIFQKRQIRESLVHKKQKLFQRKQEQYGTQELLQYKEQLLQNPSELMNNRLVHKKMDNGQQSQYSSNGDESGMNQYVSKDRQMARKIQKQYDQQDQKRPVQQEAPCQICYQNLFDEQVSILYCGHIFHRKCLIETYKHNILSNLFPIKCACDDCQQDIPQSDLKNIFPHELFQKYQEQTLKSYAEENGDSVSWCPTPGCEYMFFHLQGDQNRFVCLQCNKEYCLNCRVQWHKDMSCKEYQVHHTITESDKQFIQFAKGNKFKQCPKCKFWVQKNQGCDHMTCKCKFQFCYKCGGVYRKCQCVQKQRQQHQERNRHILEINRQRIQRREQAMRIKKQQKEEQRARKKQEKARIKKQQRAEKARLKKQQKERQKQMKKESKKNNKKGYTSQQG